MRKILSSLALLIVLTLPLTLVAGQFADGMAALGRGDYTDAIKLFRPLAERGHNDAQYNLAFMYFMGHGVEKDRKTALTWYRKSADQGHPVAQFSIGQMYRYGRGVRRDYSEAVKWYKRAARVGWPAALNNLAAAYLNGEGGLDQSYLEAYVYLTLASERGDPYAKRSVVKLRDEFTDVLSMAPDLIKERRAEITKNDQEMRRKLSASAAAIERNLNQRATSSTTPAKPTGDVKALKAEVAALKADLERARRNADKARSVAEAKQNEPQKLREKPSVPRDNTGKVLSYGKQASISLDDSIVSFVGDAAPTVVRRRHRMRDNAVSNEFVGFQNETHYDRKISYLNVETAPTFYSNLTTEQLQDKDIIAKRARRRLKNLGWYSEPKQSTNREGKFLYVIAADRKDSTSKCIFAAQGFNVVPTTAYGTRFKSIVSFSYCGPDIGENKLLHIYSTVRISEE